MKKSGKSSFFSVTGPAMALRFRIKVPDPILQADHSRFIALNV